MDERFSNGAFLVSRSIFDTKQEGPESLWMKPPYFVKLWLWFLGRANHKNITIKGQKFERGTFLTTLDEIVKQTRFKAGGRKVSITRRQAWSVLEWMRNEKMIKTRKTTKGIFITLLQYDEFQNIKNYKTPPVN